MQGETTAQSDKNVLSEKSNDRNGFGGGRGVFGSGKSILNLMAERLENLKAQFAGTAEKSTEPSAGISFGGFGRNKGEFNFPEDMNPDKMNDMPNFMGGNPADMPMLDFGGENSSFPQNFYRKMPAGDVNGRMGRNGNGFGFNSKNESNVIRVHVDGHIVNFETDPVLKNDATLVEFRAILEALGAEVVRDETTQTVTAIKNDTTIILTIDSNIAYINGKPATLLAEPVIIGDSIMIPVRFVSENMGMKVSWNGETKLITVNSK